MLASYTLSQISQEVKGAVSAVMTQVYPIKVGNTKSNRTKSCTLCTSLSYRAQGYKFLCLELEVCI